MCGSHTGNNVDGDEEAVEDGAYNFLGGRGGACRRRGSRRNLGEEVAFDGDILANAFLHIDFSVHGFGDSAGGIEPRQNGVDRCGQQAVFGQEFERALGRRGGAVRDL